MFFKPNPKVPFYLSYITFNKIFTLCFINARFTPSLTLSLELYNESFKSLLLEVIEVISKFLKILTSVFKIPEQYNMNNAIFSPFF